MLTPKLYECQYLHVYYNLLISEVNQNEFLPTSNLKNNEKFNLLYMRVHNQNQWIIDTTSVRSYCSIPSSSQTSCYKLYTHWTLPHCHTLGVAMVPVGEQHPEKQEGKMDLIIHLRNTDYAIQITCFTGLTGVWLLVIMYQVLLAQCAKDSGCESGLRHDFSASVTQAMWIFFKIIPFILFKCWLSYRVDQEYQILNKKFKWGLFIFI